MKIQVDRQLTADGQIIDTVREVADGVVTDAAEAMDLLIEDQLRELAVKRMHSAARPTRIGRRWTIRRAFNRWIYRMKGRIHDRFFRDHCEDYW